MPTHKYFAAWPDRVLRVNGSQAHWSKKSTARKKQKNDSYYLALESGLGKIGAETVSVTLTFYPPSRRKFDADNTLASCKGMLDGLALAIGIDDSKFQVTPRVAGAIEKNGLVKIELEW